MCGIAGLIEKNNNVDKGKLQVMIDSIKHRGPDDEGIFVDGGVGLGNRRLAIIDTSKKGHQPMHDGDLVITFNGEIYNFQELKKDPRLANERFVSGSDTEVLLKLYKHYGTEMLSKLNGMFALAIYRKEKREVFIARDRLGIKPLYYYHKGGTFAFASEIKELLASGIVPKILNRDIIFDYLIYGSIPEPYTIVKDVFVLPAGHYGLIKDDTFTLHSYWELPCPNSEAGKELTYRKAVSLVRDRLEASVKRRLVSDVPLGAFLSGGIDSSAIVGLMAKNHKGLLKTFSVIFPEETHISEQPFALTVASHLKTDQTEVQKTGRDLKRDLRKIITAMDQPTVDGINSYYVSQAAHDGGLTVSLSGLGGDELFQGYRTFTKIPKLLKLIQLNKPLPKRIIPWLFAHHPKIRSLLLQKNPTIIDTYKAVRGVLAPDVAKALLVSCSQDNTLQTPASNSSVTLLEFTRYLRNQLLRDTDVMSMAHSLEVRVPFLDHELVELVLSLPDHFKHRRNATKPLLADAVSDLLPDQTFKRQKQGFALPMKSWIKNHLSEMIESQVLPLVKKQGILEFQAVKQHWNDFKIGNVRWSRIWVWIVLTLWIEQHDLH